MNTDLHAVLLIVIAAAVTFLLRGLPFWIFGGKRRMPASVKSIADRLPPAIIAVLVIYCLKEPLTQIGAGTFASAAALAVVAAVHLWKRNTLFSVAAGTAVYMILIRALL